jgi:hypothetical protein
MARNKSEMEEIVYQDWARLPNKMDRHAIRDLSQKHGVPIKTIHDWKDRYNWVGKWLQDVHAVAPTTLEIGLATLTQGWPLVTARLIDIIATGQAKDAVNASRVYAQIVGVDKQAPLAPDKRAIRTIDPDMIDRVKGMSREELWALAKDQGSVHMDRALAQRSQRMGQMTGSDS